MLSVSAVRPDSTHAWILAGDAQSTLTLQTQGRNWLNAVIASGNSATAAVQMRVDGELVAQITLRAGATWSPAFAVPQALPSDAVIEVTSDEIAHVSVFGFRAA